MAAIAFTIGLLLVAAWLIFMFVRPGVDDSKGASLEEFAPPPEPAKAKATNRYKPWTPGPPEASVTITPARGQTRPPELRGLRAFERVSDNGVIVDISPDGREAMFLHDSASVTIYDVAAGTPVTTWHDICPPEWLETLRGDSGFSCAARRLFVGWRENGDAPEDHYVNALIDLEKREVTRLYEAEDSLDSINTAAMSANGRYVACLLYHADMLPAFDLDFAAEESAEAPAFCDSGEYFWTPGGIWPAAALSEDGRSFAFDRGAGETTVMRQGDAPETVERDEWGANWPYYSERAFISGDASPTHLAFDETGEFLLIAESDLGLIVADLEANDFEVLKPFAERTSGDDEAVICEIMWPHGRRQAIVAGMLPSPGFYLVDLDNGAILEEWPATGDIVNSAMISPTGAYALARLDEGETCVFPLLEAPS